MNLANQLERRTALFFVIIALPVVLFFSLATPPLMAPDEWDHTARAINVAEGQWLPVIRPDLPPAANIPKNYLDMVFAQHDIRLSSGRYGWEPFEAHSKTKWGETRLIGDFASEAYFPLAYLPQAAVLRVSLWADWPIVATLRWGRLVLGVLYVALGAAILLFAQSTGRVALLMIFSTPLTLSLFASFSPDALVILGGAFIAIMIAKQSNGAVVKSGFVIASLITALVLMALKISFLPIAIWVIWVGWQNRTISIRWSLAAVVGIFGGLGWNFAYVRGPDRIASGIDPAMQFSTLLEDPLSVFQIAINTWKATGLHPLASWFDFTMVPGLRPTEWLLSFLIFGIFLIFFLDPIRPLRTKKTAIIALVSITSVLALTFAALYLAWTKVGSMGPVHGFQGRYLLPLLPFFILGTSLLPKLKKTRSLAIGLIVPIWLLTCVVVSFWMGSVYFHPGLF